MKAHDKAVCMSKQPAPSRLDRARGTACSLYKGECGLTGEASLACPTADTHGSLRRQQPHAAADDIVAEYLSFVSDKATAGGCFYQASTGFTPSKGSRWTRFQEAAIE